MAFPQLVQEVGHAAFEYCKRHRLDGIDARHFGAVIDNWRSRLQPWWAEMFLQGLAGIHRWENSMIAETLVEYGIVRLERSGQIEVSPFISDIVTHDRSRRLEYAIADVLSSDTRYASNSTSSEGPTPTKINLFFCYSHKDEALRDELAAHLRLLERNKVIGTWHDRRIGAGEEWREAINDNLEKAHLVLLLVSSDFLSSDYCYDVEMTRALSRQKAGETVVIPIILRACKWDGAPFANLQALPRDAMPVTSWSNRDEAWTSVVAGIESAIARIKCLRSSRYKP